MKKILMVKIAALGDLIYALPAAQALKSAFPCHITWVVAKSYAPLLQNQRYIDSVITVDDKKLYAKSFVVRALELLKLFLKCRQRFDQVIIAHRDPLYYRVFRWLSRGSTLQMVRNANKTQPSFVYIPPLTIHESLAIKKLIMAAIQSFQPDCIDIIWEWDYSHLPPTTLALPANYIVLHLGGGTNAKTEFTLKCWPHWQALVMRLLAETEANLVFVGSPAEECQYKIIATAIEAQHPAAAHRCFNLMKNLSITAMVDVIRRARVFIGVDSGPLHIADSLHKIALGLYGPTSSVSWGLLSANGVTFQQSIACSPCYKDNAYFPPCYHAHRCMQELTVEPVLTKLKEFI